MKGALKQRAFLMVHAVQGPAAGLTTTIAAKATTREQIEQTTGRQSLYKLLCKKYFPTEIM